MCLLNNKVLLYSQIYVNLIIVKPFSRGRMYKLNYKYFICFFLLIFTVITFNISISFASELSERAKKLDTNNNGFIDKNEAMGPLKSDFIKIDTDDNGLLDGKEISSFFQKKFGSQSNNNDSQSKNNKDDNNNPNILPSRIKFLDTNNNNLIEKKEASESSFLASRFSSIDKNTDDVITPEELSKFFSANQTAVFVDKVQSSKLNQTISVIGSLVSNSNGPISSKVSGTMDKVMVKVGNLVKKNDLLFKMQQDEYELEAQRRFAIVKQRQSQVKIAQLELAKILMNQKRIDGLKNSSAFSKKKSEDIRQDILIKKSVVNERESLLEQAVEELNRANLNLKNTMIKAPFEGMVTKINTGVGSFVTTGMTVINILDTSNMEITAQVPINIVSSLKNGKRVLINFDSSKKYEAFVRAILSSENQLTRTLEVRFSLNKNMMDTNLILNKSVNIDIPVYAEDTGLTVHKDAVISKNNKSYVFVVVSRKVMQRDIKIIGSNNERFIVNKGLKEGDLVVIRGNESLRDNQNIKVINPN